MKKIHSLLLLGGLLLFGAQSAWAGTRTLYFINTDGWETPKCYYWGGSSSTTWVGAPAMTITENKFGGAFIYSVGIPDDATQCNIYKNGDDSKRTGDLTIDADKVYYDFKAGIWVDISELSTYYIKTNWCDNGDWTYQQMTANGNGTYSYVGTWGNSGCNWKYRAEDDGERWITVETITGGNSYTTGEWYTFTLNPTEGTIALSAAPASALCTVKVLMPSGDSKYAHAYGNDIAYTKWHGVAGSAETIKGVSYASRDIKVRKNAEMNLIINNNNDKQTAPIHVGKISKDTTVFYDINSGDFSFNAICGSFDHFDNNEWRHSKIMSNSTNSVDIQLPASTSYDIKFAHCYHEGVEDKAIWAGKNGTASITASGSYTFVKDEDVVSFTTGIAGYYKFHYDSWDGDNITVTTTYPTLYERTSLSAGVWGTICLSGISNATYDSNAKFYSISHKTTDGEGNPTSIVLVEEEGELIAGRPYIFHLISGTSLSLPYTGSESAGNYRGLVGTLDAIDASAMSTLIGATNVYLLKNTASGGEVGKAATGSTLGANKAYIDMNNVPTTPFAGAPGRLIEMPLGPNNATNIDAIEATENAVKFIQNGKLFIKKNGIVYDMMGTIVK